MRNIILFDDQNRDDLLPLTFTRPTSELRCGILSLREKWEKYLDGKASFITQEYLSSKYPIDIQDNNYVINGHILPNERLVKLILELNFNEAIMHNDDLVAARLNKSQFDHLIDNEQIEELSGYLLEETPAIKISHPWDLFLYNDQEIRTDYALLTEDRESAGVADCVELIGSDIFVEEGAEIGHCVINTETGPVYIGKNAQIMEGCLIRGPLALGDSAVLKMGTKIYGATTIGPYCKAAGEVKNSLMMGFSNKSHDGYLGNSVIGEWCNLGANTNNSNLKNNFSNIRAWNYPQKTFINTKQARCGLIMGDHSKTSINTMFNTATVVGVCSNLFGEGFPSKFIPSFSWGGKNKMEEFDFEQALKSIERVFGGKEIPLTKFDVNIFQSIFDQTKEYRQNTE